MIVFNFKNSKLQDVYDKSTLATQLKNENSSINSINTYNKTTIISGEYDCKFNFYGNCNIHLDNNFKILNGSLNAFNDSESLVYINIYGVLNFLKSNIDIIADNKVVLGLSIFSNDNNLINLMFNTADSLSEFYVNEIDMQLNSSYDEMKIKLKAPNTGTLKIQKDLESIDFNLSQNLKLIIENGMKISTFENINEKTFLTVEGASDVLKQLQNSTDVQIPIGAIFYLINTLDGKSDISKLEIKDNQNLKVAVILNGKEYFLNKA